MHCWVVQNTTQLLGKENSDWVCIVTYVDLDAGFFFQNRISYIDLCHSRVINEVKKLNHRTNIVLEVKECGY